MAANVIETLLKQWYQLAGSVVELVNHDVRQIRALDDGRIRVIAEGPLNFRSRRAAEDPHALHNEPSGNFREFFDIVILAVGFGLERALTSVPFRSYWENDNLGRAVIAGPVPRYYLVTGCGDGGLIDAIRLRIRGFDHARFVYSLLSLPGIERVKDRLLSIDKEASEVEAKKELIDVKARRARASELAEFIEREYDALFFGLPPDTLAQLASNLSSQLRDDTVVFLNSPNSSPLNFSTAILNRIAVFLLLRFGGLRYRQGEVTVSPGQPDHMHITFHRQGVLIEDLDVHEIVVRHGPSRTLDKLLPSSIVDQLLPINAVNDISRSRAYEQGFWDSDQLKNIKRRVLIEHAGSNFHRALEGFLAPTKNGSMGIEITSNDVQYVVTTAESSRDDGTPSEFAGIPLVYRGEPPSQLLDVTSRRFSKISQPGYYVAVELPLDKMTLILWREVPALSVVSSN